jgi:hypothetical protein
VTRRSGSFAVAGALSLGLVACVGLASVRHWALAELVVTAAWGLALLGSFAGWGVVVERVSGQRANVALRAVWGASLLAFAGGLLASASLLGRAVLVVFVGGGIALQLWTWLARDRERLARGLRAGLRAARLHPAATFAGLFVWVAVAVHYVGGAADFYSNPYDDDVAYHTFTKLLVQRGTLIDPFSFRRMSTLGGQSFFHALVYLRAPLLHTNVFDRGICLVLAAALVALHRFEGRRPRGLVRLVALVFLVTLPYTGINTASYYSGLVWFFALYESLALLPDAPVETFAEGLRRTFPLALVGAAACTLRQNYQAQVAFFVLLSYGLLLVRRRRAAPMRKLLLEPLACIALVTVFVLPWLVLSYRSSATFLFPVMRGTLRQAIKVQSPLMTPGKLVRFFADVWLTPLPITTLPLFALVGLLVRERSARAPLASQWLATLLSIAALSVGFSMSDAGNLARYDYGFAMTGALVTWLAVGERAFRRRGVPAAVPAGVLAAAMAVALHANVKDTKKMFDRELRDTSELLRRSVPPQEESPVAASYRRLQAAVPPGATMLVLLDQPYLLDFSRNRIFNLDMPGLASPAPGIPCFRGPEPVADYLTRLGIRYVAFVENAHSTYLYRRDIWFEHLYDPDVIWRVFAPYMIDVMDNLARLAETRVHLHDEAGMVLLDLSAKR